MKPGLARGLNRADWTRPVPDEDSVAVLAARFARLIKAPMVIYLEGDLGTGKTTFARAFIHALGFKAYVKSPSYGLLESYSVSGMTILHLDLYRIENPEELEYLALRDLHDANSVLLVEWPRKAGTHLPAPDLVLEFRETDERHFIRSSATTTAGFELNQAILQEL
ncbi:MAG: tRNA (adenosine(37)-N6)-threonylcarbamoyltransferase complex ATPase subunit type 1 TsaE [Xanthomonadales bacterium]